MACGGCGKKKNVTKEIYPQQIKHQQSVLSKFMESRKNIVKPR